MKRIILTEELESIVLEIGLLIIIVGIVLLLLIGIAAFLYGLIHSFFVTPKNGIPKSKNPPPRPKRSKY